jgi:hypothetical protein
MTCASPRDQLDAFASYHCGIRHQVEGDVPSATGTALVTSLHNMAADVNADAAKIAKCLNELSQGKTWTAWTDLVSDVVITCASKIQPGAVEV